ncbi:MAG: hypothetical protein K8R85_14720 [Bacteroidetes bacterium]|nr:hypothetical protein [Bacteroidota bacterium]
MNLLPYLHNVTISIVGEQHCQYCGEEDYFFALEGECMECHKPLPRHNNNDAVIYAASVLQEFFEKYEELCYGMPNGKEFNQVILKELSTDIAFTKKMKRLPDDSRILKFQAIFANTPPIGSKKFGAGFSFVNSVPQLGFTKELPNPLERMKSISAVICSVRFILKLQVKNNDFVL